MKSEKKKYYACDLDQLKTINSIACDISIENETIQCFVIHHQNNITSYVNSCPHTGVNLDWLPNKFLDKNAEFIQCATHGALFNIDNGLCVHGPCSGDKLKMIENEVIDNKIYLIL